MTFKVGDKVKVVGGKHSWFRDEHKYSSDTVLTIVEDHDDKSFVVSRYEPLITLDGPTEYPKDFELVYSESIESHDFADDESGWKLSKTKPFLVDNEEVFINDAMIGDATIITAAITDETSSRAKLIHEINECISQSELGIARPILETRKADKIRMELFDDGFPNAILEIAKVLTWAQRVKGYKDHDWHNLPDPENSLKGAGSRHRRDANSQKMAGVPAPLRVDHESNYHHLAHQAFNILAELELILTGKIV